MAFVTDFVQQSFNNGVVCIHIDFPAPLKSFLHVEDALGPLLHISKELHGPATLSQGHDLTAPDGGAPPGQEPQCGLLTTTG